ncbi:MAG: DUF4190 domain-containing protein [Pyrinomonadaceae bacterium]
MKRCPTCDKTFPDSMRFCQTDGTVLGEDAPPVDPYKTVVGNQSGIAAAIPPVDPFKTMVAIPPPKPKEEDILELPPEPPDAMKTLIVSQDNLKVESKFEDVPKLDLPPTPIIEPKTGTPSDATAVMNSSSAPEIPAAAPPFDSKPLPNDFSGESPYGNTDNLPIPSPFQLSMPPGYQPPSGSPFDEPPTVMQSEPVSVAQPPSSGNTPFDEPAPQTPFNQAESSNQPFQQSEWTPPPAPVSEWQNQGLGANTPFQPPVAGGQDKTLAIVSLVCGILSIVCCGLLAGIPAIITGYMAKNKVDQNPQQYTGRGMAVAGMILGGISIVLTIGIIILEVMLGAFSRF